MCRILRSQGHRVTLADMEKFKFSASRFSRSVSKWVTLPDVSDQSGLQYKVTHSTQVSGLTLPQEALKGLIVRGEFDWWIPVSHIHTAVMDVEVRMELEKENSSVKVLAMEEDLLKVVYDVLALALEKGVVLKRWKNVHQMLLLKDP